MTDGVPMDDTLDVLACEYQKRPRGAPSFFDLQPSIREVQREPHSLVITFEPDAASNVEALAAAERLCCTTIGFDVTRDPAPTLRISATDAQLEVFEQFLTT